METLKNLPSILLILACGSCSTDLILPLKEKNQYSNCTNQIPSDLSIKIRQAYERNILNRNEAIASERQRLQVEPLNLSSVWSETKFLPLQLSFFYRG
ncbi:MAG: hypothetical protein AB8G05_25085 [Oligoflexales bacterium]